VTTGKHLKPMAVAGINPKASRAESTAAFHGDNVPAGARECGTLWAGLSLDE